MIGLADTRPHVNIVDRTRIEFPCPSCGGRYPLTLAQVLLSQAILHDGCQARAEGMRTLREDGLLKVLSGHTSIEETARAVG